MKKPLDRSKCCWHPVGHETIAADGSSGNEWMVCCNCGTERMVAWRRKHKRIRGHGPHGKEPYRAYTWPDKKCGKPKAYTYPNTQHSYLI